MPYLGMMPEKQVTISDVHATKSKAELMEEVMRLNKELRVKTEEIAMLKKRLLLYKSLGK